MPAIDSLPPRYKNWHKPEDLLSEHLSQIRHFFAHYKDLEPGKSVKVAGWPGPKEARPEIMASVARYQPAPPRPKLASMAPTQAMRHVSPMLN